MAIIDRIKFDGLRTRDWLIYKYPGEEFVAGSQLIVSEGQVALFIKGGTVCDMFLPGTYTLESDNLPLIQQFINIPFGGKTPFTAEIYYINTTNILEMNWGTSDPIQIIDPKYFVRLHIRAFGQLSFKLTDYKQFFTELIGAMDMREIIHTDKILDFFRGVIVTKVKTVISSLIIQDKISALEIAPHLESISDQVESELSKELDQYGVHISQFLIQSINFPNEDFEQINKILQDKAAFEIMGDQRYNTKRSFDVYDNASSNANGATNAAFASGLGLTAGINAAQVLSSTLATSQQKPVQSTQETSIIHCPNCNAENSSGAKFCNQCGTPLQETTCECGAPLAPGSKFCSSCGKKVQ